MTMENKHTEEMLKSVLDATDEAIYGIDLQGKCTFVNKSCIEILGYKQDRDLVGKSMHRMIHHSKSDGSPYPPEECETMDAVRKGLGFHSEKEVLWRRDGSPFYAECRTKPLIVEGKLMGAVVTFRDITEKVEADEKIRYHSYHDPVTGLYNQTFLNEEIKRLDVERNLPFSIIMGDVNGLKLMNDIFGHDAGDALLKEISQAISSCCRSDDIIARVGGDEFVILLPGTTGVEAEVIRDRIRQAAKEVSLMGIKGSIALGCTTKEITEEDFFDLLRDVEEEMYRDKSLNRKKYHEDQLENIMEILHLRSEKERIHSFNVRDLSEKIAEELNLPEASIRRIRDGGYYHDIGKVVLDEDLLQKHGDYTKEEAREMGRHITIGYRILNLFNNTMDIARGALNHHEHWDGTGEPMGLKGEEISLIGRVVAVAEQYDHRTNPLSNERTSHKEAVEEIRSHKGTRFDPWVVDAFLRVMEKIDGR